MKTRDHRAPRAALLLLLALAAPAAAQEPDVEGYRYLPDEMWGRLPATTPPGTKYYVMGRWAGCWSNQIALLAGPKDPFFFANEAQQLSLAGNLIPGATNPAAGRLTDKRTRVRLQGRVDRLANNRLVLVIDKVVKLEDDAVRLQTAALTAGTDAARIAAVAREIQTLHERYKAVGYDDQELAALHVRVKQRELAVRRDALADDDFTGWLALAADYAALDRPTAIALFAHVAKNAQGAPRERALHELGKLGARDTRNGWVTYEAFKTGEGFLERKLSDGAGTRWVRKEQAEFDDLRVEEQLLRAKTIVEHRQNPVQHGNNAQASKLEKGQTLEEARAAAGQPAAVYHVRAPDSTAQDARPAVWTQWIWADGKRAYFLGREGDTAIMFAVKTPKDPWPTK